MMRPVFLLVALLAATPAHAQVPIGGAFDGQTGYQQFRSAIGQAPTLVDSYIDERLPSSQWIASANDDASSRLASAWASSPPVVGLPMGSIPEGNLFKQIASGSMDGILRGILHAYAAAGFPIIYLRPGFEFSGNWFVWGVTPGNVNDFIAAFERIASIAHGQTELLVLIVWNPNVGDAAVPLTQLWPGSASVDVIGPDTYGAPIGGPDPNDGGGGPNSITVSNTMAMARQYGKPFAIPETGTADASFVTTLGRVIAGKKASVAFVNIWDTNAACGGCWIAPGSAVAQAWQAAIALMNGSDVGAGPFKSTGQEKAAVASAVGSLATAVSPVATTATDALTRAAPAARVAADAVAPVIAPVAPEVDPAVTQAQAQITQADSNAGAETTQIQAIVNQVNQQIEALQALIASGAAPPAAALVPGQTPAVLQQ